MKRRIKRKKRAGLVIDFLPMTKGAVLPNRADRYSIGYDLYTPYDIRVPAHSRFLLPLGFGIALPFGIEGKIEPRSGFSSKGVEGLGKKYVKKKWWFFHYKKSVSGKLRFDCDVLVGKIDPGYKDEVHVILKNNDESFVIPKGTKIAQMSFYKTLRPRFSFVDKLTGFDRGGGLGHTGSK